MLSVALRKRWYGHARFLLDLAEAQPCHQMAYCRRTRTSFGSNLNMKEYDTNPTVLIVVEDLRWQSRARVGVADGGTVRLGIALHEVFVRLSSWLRYVNDIIFYVFRV